MFDLVSDADFRSSVQLVVFFSLSEILCVFAPAAVQKEAVVTDKAPAALGPYSQAIKSGNLVFCSGVLGLVPEVYSLQFACLFYL